MIINNIGINFAGGGGGGSDAKLESKDYNLTANGSTTIRPSSGYDGISGGTIQVNVDMQPAYNSGYTEGYASGYTSGETDGYSTGYASGYTSGETAGIAEQKALLTSTTITENGNYTRENGYSAVTVNVPQIGENKLNKLFTNTLTAVTQNDLDGVTGIRDYGFYGCTNLKTVDLPASVKTLYQHAFHNSGIETLDVSNITLIGGYAFQGCKSLTGLTGFESYTGQPQSSIFEDCTALTGDFRTSMMYESQYSAGGLFKNCKNLRSITWLESQAYANYNSTYSNIYQGCTSIEFIDYTHNVKVAQLPFVNPFTDFTTNYEIRVPQILYDSWTAATNWNNSAIVNHIVAYPNPYPTYTTIKYHTSNGSALTASYESPDWIGYDSKYGFLVSNEFDSVTGGTVSFYGKIGTEEGAFTASTVTDIEFNDFYREIHSSVCNNCRELTSVTLNNCYKIGDNNEFRNGPFSYCTALTNVYISGNVEYISASFMYDSALNNITINCTTPPELHLYSFAGCPRAGTLYVPSELISVYTNWIVGTPLSGWTVTAITE